MAKDRMRAAAARQVGAAAREIPRERKEKTGIKPKRDERLVIRLSADELRRLAAFAGEAETPLSTLARAVLLKASRTI